MRTILKTFGFWVPIICYTGAEEAAPAVSGGGKAAAEAAPALSEIGPATGTILPAGVDAATGAVSSAAAGAGLPAEAALAAGAGAGAGGGGGGAPVGGGEGAVGAPGVVPGAPGAITETPIPAGPAATPATPAPPAQVVGGTTPTATNLPVGGGGGAALGGETLPPDVTKVPPTPPGGISKALQTIGVTDKTGGIGPNALPIAALTAGQINANRTGKSAQAQLQKLSQPAQSASQQLLAEGTSGQVPPAVMQQFDQSLREKTDEIVQRYANMGRDAKTDSAAQAEIAKAKDARDAQIANYSSSLTSQGLQAAGVAAGPATAAIQAGVQSDKDLQAAMSGSLQNMALLAALQRGQTTGAAPAGAGGPG